MRTPRPLLVLAALAALATAGSVAPATAEPTFPPGFSAVTLASGLNNALAVDWAPDGRMFIAEKRGVVKVVDPNGTMRTLLDISDHVNSAEEHGLLGLAVDKQFASNPYLYLYYVYEADPQHPLRENKTARLTRVTVLPNDTVANPGSPETTLLGSYPLQPCPSPSNAVDCIPGETDTHNGGAVRSAPDGTIWLAVGDADCCGVIDGKLFRPYDVQSFAGKLIHVTRNGRGLANHPFCASDSNLSHVCTKLYAKGFRNPFRFTLRPKSTPVLGDVGESAQEEIDFVNPGANYGWPCYEGTIHTPAYSGLSRCKAEYARQGTASADRPPAWSYLHNGQLSAVIGGPTYTGTSYPGFQGSIFVGDWGQGWIKRLTLDSFGRVSTVQDFASGWIGADLEQAPDGNLVYSDFSSVKEVVYTP